MKEIIYTCKNTTAKTQYYKISKSDMEWLQKELTRYLSLIGELSKDTSAEVKSVIDDYWRQKNKSLPSSKSGYNTPESFISGTLNNLMFGNQYDLSNIQTQAIEYISKGMEVIYQNCNGLAYQPKCEPLTEIKFKESLFITYK